MVAMIVRFFVLLCFEMTAIKAPILRLHCLKHADFSIQKINEALPDFVLQTHNGVDEPLCVVNCVKHPKCRSYNIHREDRICELNSKALWDDGAILVSRPGWDFMSTDYNATLLGPTCETLNPCENGILCRDKCESPFYECVYCDRYHYGLHCDKRKDLNECLSNPCMNGGTCTDLVADFRCTCVAGYIGKRCQTEIKECDSYPCINGGQCVERIGNYVCKCTYGFTGKNCGSVHPVYCSHHRIGNYVRTQEHNNLLDWWSLDVNCRSYRLFIHSFLLQNTPDGTYISYLLKCCEFYNRFKCHHRRALSSVKIQVGNADVRNLDGLKVDCGEKSLISRAVLQKSADNSEMWYSYRCCNITEQADKNKLSCKNEQTPDRQVPNGTTSDLFGWTVSCSSNYVMSSFVQKVSADRQRISYHLSCCKYID